MGNVKIGGYEVDFDAAVNLMDDDIRDEIHNNLTEGGMTEQQFADAYCDAHLAKYGEDFKVN